MGKISTFAVRCSIYDVAEERPAIFSHAQQMFSLESPLFDDNIHMFRELRFIHREQMTNRIHPRDEFQLAYCALAV